MNVIHYMTLDESRQSNGMASERQFESMADDGRGTRPHRTFGVIGFPLSDFRRPIVLRYRRERAQENRGHRR